jgi:hypothetical protein
MRLLECNNDSEFSLTKDFGRGKIPEYATLSHTWGADIEEVTYRDLIDGTGKNKVGYEKIRFCGEQARHDGLQYFWVDTCCIDKSNNNELAEAINSMFRWYRDAVKCYVFLVDVPRADVDTTDHSHQLPWESAFRTSRWFTRGWTLQELIAPTSVEFFSENWELLGDRISLERHICEITRIPSKALRGSPLAEFSATERMSWAETRQTTREEDIAYSLLGIFDVYMPLIYGEGREHAFKRLRKEIQNSLTGEHTINCFISGYMLILFCKKTIRCYSTPKVEVVFRTYGQQIPARIRSGSRTRRAACCKTPTSGSSNIPASNNGATTISDGCSGLRATPAKARQC